MNRFGISLELTESFSIEELLNYDRAELLHKSHEELEKTVPKEEILVLMGQIVQELEGPDQHQSLLEKMTWLCKETFFAGFTCCMDVLLNRLSKEQIKEAVQV